MFIASGKHTQTHCVSVQTPMLSLKDVQRAVHLWLRNSMAQAHQTHTARQSPNAKPHVHIHARFQQSQQLLTQQQHRPAHHQHALHSQHAAEVRNEVI
jgi:hypothetical protein